MTPKATLATLTLLCVSPFCVPLAEGQNAIFVANPSFEGITASVTAPTLPGTSTGSIGAWTASATGVIALGSSVASNNNFGVTPLDGTFSVRFSFGIGVGNIARLSQNLTGISYVSNSLYQLTLDINTGTFAGAISGANIELLAGGATVATLTGANLVSLLNPTSPLFQTVTLNYSTTGTAPAGDIGIRITGGGLAAVAASFYVDNVRLTQTPVPEPSAIVASLAGAGLLGLVMRRRRVASAPLQ